ncbi:BA14K family protein [Kaistia granuli]|jgi:hypothetical protein|uniref:BA14K family protein n=1 Tax=Kaistia granuli TaxID=363259 RepID=UPI000372BA38|nr:BA14K family protein [Kaistia granuli]
MLTQFKNLLKAGLAVAVVATSFVTFGAPAQAAESGVRSDGSYQVADNWNGRRGNWNGNRNWRGGNDWRWRHGNRWHNRGGYYYNDNNNWGGAAAAGIIGLAAGAMIANSANQQRYYDAPAYYGGDDYVAYCSNRYRTFNPRTGTFTGNDGLQHRCVMR